MYRRLILISTALLLSLGIYAQPRIGFTNLNGFPSVITNGNTYNVSGYIRNTGTDTLFAGVDIQMSVNNGPTIPIQNNVSFSGPLAPGDSVYWSKGGHGFPGGQFAPGNNDVLIWPTRMSGPGGSVEVDTLLKNMFFIDGEAAFQLCNPIQGFNEALPLREMVTIDACGENVGDEHNDGEVGLFMSINGSAAYLLDMSGNQVQPGGQVNFSIENFLLHDYFLHLGLEAADDIGGNVTFWIAEGDGLEPVNRQIVPIGASTATGVTAPESALNLIYPNPASNVLRIGYAAGMEADISSVRVYSLHGQLLMSYEGAVPSIVVQDLAPGHYFLTITSGEAIQVKSFIKE